MPLKIKGATSGSVTLKAPDTGSDVDLNTNDLLMANGDGSQLTGISAGGTKNLIINGGFDVWQRGTSFSPANANKYTADRWYGYYQDTTITQETETYSGTKLKALKVICTNASLIPWIAQKIENNSWASNKTITVSFLVKTTSAFSDFKVGYSVENGSGSSLANGQIGSNIAVTTSFVRHSVSISIADLSSNTLDDAGSEVRIEFKKSAGAGNFTIAQVQLEFGSTVSDFEHRSYGEELALCQRYYQVVSLAVNYIWYYTSAWGTSNTSFPFATVMRDSPTISYGFTTCTNAQPGGASGGSFGGSATTEHCRLTCSISSSYQQWSISTVSGGDATKDVRFDAEL